VPRPRLKKRIHFDPSVVYFKPRGVPMKTLEEISLTMEEMEAIRLKNVEGFNQEDAAARMKTSQSTFQRILTSANKKIAVALVKGCALKIEKS
jgi:predicted DNA-binding protein (UPF0251 family)